MDLWLDIDIACLGVLPQHHIRSITIENTHGFLLSSLVIPECLFETPTQRLRMTKTLETHTQSMENVVEITLTMLRNLQERHRSLARNRIVLVPALRDDTYVEGEEGDKSEEEHVLGVKDKE